MSEISVEQLAQEYNAPKEEFVILLKNNNVSVKNASSVLSEEQANTFRRIHSKPEVRKSIRQIQEDLKNKKPEETKKPAKAPKKASNPEPKESKAASNKQNKPNRPDNKAKGQNADKGDKAVKTQQRPNNQNRQNQRRKNNREDSNQNNNRNNRSKQQTRSNNSSNQQNSQNRNNRNAGKPNQKQGNYQKSNSFKRNNNAGASFSNSNQSKPAKKQKKNYKDKKAERPIKLRDNRKRTKNKRVDYKKQREERQLAQKKNRVYEIPELLTIGQLAETLDIAATEIIKVLMANGTMATINQQIDADTAEIVASELGYDVQTMTTEDVVEKIFEEYDNQVTGKEVKRPPVVTVMGHVDHGKTSLLDRIRKTNVTAGEAGGITQHIGAYTVRVGDEKITFIDTPGHAAFTAMRSRGAKMTDIAVLVVAADDGVMPQTVEAINHAKAAEVPIIVAINKIDKEGSSPDRVKQELTEQGLVVEEWGGDTIAVPISARQGTNIDELLENILLVAEVEELKADPNRPARGSVIESEVKKGKGSTASLLIQQGTLNVGDSILSGTTYGKIRTMIDDKGKRIRRAGPSTPVEISGLSDLPEAGEDFIVLSDEKEARQLAQKRLELQKKEQQQKNAVSLNDLFTRIQEGQISDVNLIVKADVNGSVEAISQSLERLNTDEVRVNVIHGAVGAVNETDIMLASTTGAIIIAFNVRSDRIAKIAAEKEEVDVRYYTVIYDAIEDVKKAMEGLLEPEFVENVVGEAEVREVFRIPGGTMIAGSYVTDGRIKRNDQARVLRDGVIIYQGNVGSLRRFKDDVREVAQGYECGIGIENMNDIKVGDVIEVYEMEAIKREL